MMNMVEWAALGDWRKRRLEPDLVNERAEAFAAHLLERLRRRLKRSGRNLADLDDEERHRVRIVVKKLRYAAGFFETLYTGAEPRKRFKSFLKRMEALQDDLGELNDLATAPALVARVGLNMGADPPVGRRESLPADPAEAYQKLIEAKRFW